MVDSSHLSIYIPQILANEEECLLTQVKGQCGSTQLAGRGRGRGCRYRVPILLGGLCLDPDLDILQDDGQASRCTRACGIARESLAPVFANSGRKNVGFQRDAVAANGAAIRKIHEGFFKMLLLLMLLLAADAIATAVAPCDLVFLLVRTPLAPSSSSSSSSTSSVVFSSFVTCISVVLVISNFFTS